LRGGDEIVTTPFSFFASASCAALLGATPAFVDIEPGTFNIDATRIEDAITPRTKAIVPVHLYGQCADMDAILEIGARRGIPVIEDACQAIGATYASTRLGATRGAGSMGTTGAFSFFPSKNLGAFGDGGVVTTSDDALAARLRMLRVHGERERYKHEAMGWNSRLDALQAAVLRVKLPHLDAWSSGRVANADRYDRLFAEAGLVASESVTLPVRAPSRGHIFNQYTIRVRQREALGLHLKAQGIGWGIYYPIPLHLQECFEYLGYEAGDMPEAERASHEVLSLPIFPELEPAQIERVVAEIAAFFG
jgi:dTDP-4-amino-4,6-dideoxygalactose transaminase